MRQKHISRFLFVVILVDGKSLFHYRAHCKTHLLRTPSLMNPPKKHSSEPSENSSPSGKRKRAQRSTFWVRRWPGGVGVFRAKGWWLKSSCPPSKVCLPWVSKSGIWDITGILPGCPGPLAVFKKFVHKKFVRIFRSLLGGHATTRF